MIIFRKATPLTEFIHLQKGTGIKTGFVPTMGALHNGHLSLIAEAKKENEMVVSSIFVNPSQFNNKEDFAKYPVTIERDIELLEMAGCNVLFLPSEKEMYPKDYVAKKYNIGELENVLEGAHRPGHFQGVCQVVDRLLKMVEPEMLYLGQKDYQQCLVIKKLIELTNRKTTIQIVPTKREASGLAMSSRNLRLSTAQKERAAIINEMLNYIKLNVHKIDPLELVRDVTLKLQDSNFDVDYVSIADAKTLQPSTNTSQNRVALIAATIDGVRLIDNKLLNDPS